MIEAISQSQVIAIAINHEDLTDEEVLKSIADHEAYFQLPTTDVLKYGCETLIQALADRFPALNEKINPIALDAIPIMTIISDEAVA